MEARQTNVVLNAFIFLFLLLVSRGEKIIRGLIKRMSCNDTSLFFYFLRRRIFKDSVLLQEQPCLQSP